VRGVPGRRLPEDEARAGPLLQLQSAEPPRMSALRPTAGHLGPAFGGLRGRPRLRRAPLQGPETGETAGGGEAELGMNDRIELNDFVSGERDEIGDGWLEHLSRNRRRRQLLWSP